MQQHQGYKQLVMLTLSKEMSFPGSREGGAWEQHQGMQERVHGL